MSSYEFLTGFFFLALEPGVNLFDFYLPLDDKDWPADLKEIDYKRLGLALVSI